MDELTRQSLTDGGSPSLSREQPPPEDDLGTFILDPEPAMAADRRQWRRKRTVQLVTIVVTVVAVPAVFVIGTMLHQGHSLPQTKNGRPDPSTSSPSLPEPKDSTPLSKPSDIAAPSLTPITGTGAPGGAGPATGGNKGPGNGGTKTHPSPTAAPTRPPAPSPALLGDFSGTRDLNAWCIKLGYKEAFLTDPSAAAQNNWICRGKPGNDTQPGGYIDFPSACKWAYSSHTVTSAAPLDDNNPYTWRCYGY
jgi:hypothetical protein